MKQIKMPDLHVRIGEQLITVDGGWTLHVPEITQLDDQTMSVYSEAWVDSLGADPWNLERRVRETIQDVLTRVWKADAGRAITYWLRKYVKLHGTTRGFVPEIAVRLRVPGENTGRRGKAYARVALKEMYESQNGGG